jgi:hypothetical protein
VREQSLVVNGIGMVAQRLPFALRGVDTDNDSTFMNKTLQGYCQQHHIDGPSRGPSTRRIDPGSNRRTAQWCGVPEYGRSSGLAAADVVPAPVKERQANVDIDRAIEPRMRRIKDLQSFGHMGFVAPTCTTRYVRTRALSISLPKEWLRCSTHTETD